MLELLVTSFFGWLPAGLWIPVYFVISIALLTVVIRILMTVIDIVLRLADTILPW